LCEEAQRLCGLLTEHQLCNTPAVNALLALIHFQASRFGARLKESGELVMLSEQDSSKWDTALIAEGARFLAASASGEAVSKYHLEAGIAAHYALAPTFEAIAWQEVAKLYAVLLHIAPSPVTMLNAAIVDSYLHGATSGLQKLGDLEKPLGKHYLYHATRGELLKRSGDVALAREAFLRAKELTQSAVEKAFFDEHISGLE
jgi:predicted RNA polymerase sigma factor